MQISLKCKQKAPINVKTLRKPFYLECLSQVGPLGEDSWSLSSRVSVTLSALGMYGGSPISPTKTEEVSKLRCIALR